MYSTDGSAEELSASSEDMCAAQLRYFAECLAQRSEPLRCPLEDRCKVTQIMEACKESLSSSSPVPVDFGS